MCERIKASLAVVMTDPGISNSSERHGFDKQMNVDLIDRPAAEGQAREKVVDCLLVTAEQEAGKRLRMPLHLTNGGIYILVGEDWQQRSKDLVLHDRIVPGNRIKDSRIDVACVRVGPT